MTHSRRDVFSVLQNCESEVENMGSMGSTLRNPLPLEVNNEADQNEIEISEPSDGNNGLILKGYFLPPEILVHILSYVDPVPLATRGRLVCKTWRSTIDASVWWEKVLRDVPGANGSLFNYQGLKGGDFCKLCCKKPFNKNLLKNGSGQENKLDGWIVKESFHGRRWKVEKEPVGCADFPAGQKQCFVTSYDWCTAEQVIVLSEHGLTPNFMRTVRPDIHIEEWYGGRFDCGFQYSIKVSLLNFDWQVVDTFTFETTGHTTEWAKVEHTFKNYKGRVAYVVFHHKGKDTQFWAGYYGAKMTGAKVWVTLPDPPRQPEDEANDEEEEETKKGGRNEDGAELLFHPVQSLARH